LAAARARLSATSGPVEDDEGLGWRSTGRPGAFPVAGCGESSMSTRGGPLPLLPSLLPPTLCLLLLLPLPLLPLLPVGCGEAMVEARSF